MKTADLRERPVWAKVLTDDGLEELLPAGEGVFAREDIRAGVTDDVAVFVEAVRPVRRVYLAWRQELDRDVRILGDHWERGYGDMEWRGIVPERVLPWYALVWDGSRTFCYGVRTNPAAFCSFRVERGLLILDADVRCGTEGVRLGGERLCAARLEQMVSAERPFAAARAFCARLCGDPLLPKEPVYGGNDWYAAYGRNSDALIMEHARWIADWADGSPNRPFMVVDDGWQCCHWGSGGYNGGPWRWANEKFPDGMDGLAGRMKELGVRPGIWFRPLLTVGEVPREWKLKEADGGSVLDPSREEVLELVAADMKRLKDWGFELVKHDFSTYDIFGRWGGWMGSELTDGGWQFARKDRTTAQIIRRLYETLRQSAGEISIIGCNTVGHLGAGLFDIQRCGDDTSGQEWERTRKMGVNTLAFRMPQQGTFFAADGDCVGLTTHVPWEKNRQWLRLLAASGTPLFVSAQKDALGPEQVRALREAFAAASRPLPPGEPLDWTYNSCPAKWLLNGEEVEFDW